MQIKEGKLRITLNRIEYQPVTVDSDGKKTGGVGKPVRIASFDKHLETLPSEVSQVLSVAEKDQFDRWVRLRRREATEAHLAALRDNMAGSLNELSENLGRTYLSQAQLDEILLAVQRLKVTAKEGGLKVKTLAQLKSAKQLSLL